ncbi:MAG: GNAT family N-acetyltransferase [Actinomycetaceae bacterium]|nr:GNAT family N-acetyltransferase [Actinomycetaceae bacterium]MDU0969997.1 GNAT family N-acetyltransferase [Actinomycetaceae bacterium]
MATSGVTLRFVDDEETRRAVAALDVPPQDFTTPPDVVLARVAANPLMRMVAIEVDGQVSGYFALETGPAVAEVSNGAADVFLRTLAIGRQLRRRGLARAAFVALPAFLAHEYPAAKRVYLLVSEKNWPAHRLYLASGFIETGFVKQGPWGCQRVLARRLDS